jgi:hypothetical protein
MVELYLHPPYVFMAWCFTDEAEEQLYFYLIIELFLLTVSDENNYEN